MTITSGTRFPSVFESDLPTLSYHELSDPDLAHAQLAEVRSQSPIALGPYGPEVLSYDHVHTVLRDSRFAAARGLGLDSQGITAGPLWNRAATNILSIDGDAHSRLRRLVSKAFSPRAITRLQTVVHQTVTELVEALAAAGAATW